MAQSIEYEDHSKDPETIALPLSEDDAVALAFILRGFIRNSEETDFDPKTPNLEEVREIHEALLMKARSILKECYEVIEYFENEEKKTIKIVIPKPDWKNVSTIS